MCYIIVFNYGYIDHEIFTNSRGFIEEFNDKVQAETEAKKWIDGDGYRNYKILTNE